MSTFPLEAIWGGQKRLYFNLMITFIVSGIWHGAGWTFLCWGALHGLLLCIEKTFGIGRRAANSKGFFRFLHWAVTFALVCLGWIFFRARSLHDALTVISGIFTRMGTPMPEYAIFLAIIMGLSILFLKEVPEEWGFKLRLSGTRLWWAQQLYIILMTAVILLFGVLGSEQFIYFQF